MTWHAHHRKRRSQGGDDHPSNILMVTPEMHDRIHANPEWAYDMGLLVRSWEDPESVSVTIPETVEPQVKKPKQKKEPNREKVVYSVRAPKGEANVLPELVDEVREKFKAEMGWKDNVPDYFPLSLACAIALQQ